MASADIRTRNTIFQASN